jgi:hypothetical protein
VENYPETKKRYKTRLLVFLVKSLPKTIKRAERYYLHLSLDGIYLKRVYVINGTEQIPPSRLRKPAWMRLRASDDSSRH